MRKKKAKFVSLLLVLGAGQTPTTVAQSSATFKPAGAAKTAGAGRVRGTANYAKLPLSFEPCFEALCADAGSQAKYFSRGSGYLLFLASTEAVLDAGPGKKSTLRMKLLRSNSRASIEGMDPLPGKSNYFIGKNPKSWRSNVTSYAKVGVTTVAADPNWSGVDYAWVFMNLANGSIRKSIDGGVTWATIFPTTAAIFNITIDPGNSDVLYAPTVGHCAFKSIDGGQHWTPMTARTGRRPANTGSHLEPISCCWLRPRRLVSVQRRSAITIPLMGDY